MLLNALAVIAYFITCLYIFKFDKRGFVFFLMLSFGQLWAVTSCFYNDLGIYNIELLRFTEPTYATSRLAILYITFNIGFLFMMVLLKRTFPAKVDYKISGEPIRLGSLKLAVYGTIGLIIVYIVYNFTTKGIPLFLGFDRLSYYEGASRLEQLLVFFKYLFAFLLGYYRRNNKLLTVNGVILAIFLIYMILTGNKFSSLRLILCCYYVPIFSRYLYRTPDLKILRKKTLVIAFVTLTTFLGLSYGVYSWKMDDSGFAGVYLQNRLLAFEGQMWWATDYDYYNNDLYDKAHWEAELNAIISRKEVTTYDVGMKYMMIKILGPERAYAVIDTGYLFTMAYPGILLATFPFPVIFVIQFFAGVFFCIILYYLYYSIVYRHIFRSVVTMVIIVPIISVMFGGNFYIFFTFGMLIKILILLLLEMGGYKRVSANRVRNLP